MGNNNSIEHILYGGYIATLMITTTGMIYLMNKILNKNNNDIVLMTKIALYLGIDINNNTSYEELKILINNHIKYHKLADKYE